MDDSLSLRHELSLSEERRSPVGIQQPSNIRLPSLKKDMMKQRDINFVSSDGTSRRMKSLIQKIQDLNCPYLEGTSGELTKEVAFCPGEARMRLLTWMAARIGPSSTMSPRSSSTVLSVPRLTSVLADSGLCGREDFELVKGSAGATPKQVLFLESLVGVVSLFVSQQERMNTSLTDKMQSVPWKMERCCHFVDDLSRHHQLSEVFSSHLALVPPAMSLTVDRGGVATQDPQGYTQPPSLSDLNGRYEEAVALLERNVAELESLKQTCSYAELQPDALASCHKMTRVSLGTLTQLASTFCHTYEAELQPWTNTEKPRLSGLGPLCAKVNGLKENLDRLFDALALLERSYREIGRLPEVALASRDHISCDAYDAIKESLSLLKDTNLTLS